MASTLPYELLAMVLQAYENDLYTLHSCILVNRFWCSVAIQYLWAKPFVLLRPGSNLKDKIGNFVRTFIECFTDIDTFKGKSDNPKKKHSKKSPFDYAVYLKEISLSDTEHLIANCNWLHQTEPTNFSARVKENEILSIKIISLAIRYCQQLRTLSLTSQAGPSYRHLNKILVSVKSLPQL